VRCGELMDTDFADGSFDLIRMGHVIEHVLDPMATLHRAYRLLKPGGMLMGETPNTDCLDWRIFKKYWGPLHIPRHIFIFDDRNLRQALHRANFVDIEMGFGLRVRASTVVQRLDRDFPPHHADPGRGLQDGNGRVSSAKARRTSGSLIEFGRPHGAAAIIIEISLGTALSVLLVAR
jgi:SAM-dependent methyltransferase